MTLLLKNFYTEASSTFAQENKEEFSSHIILNPEHEVYKGHFEEVPVAPGVCLVQMIKEIVAKKYNHELMLTHGDNIKFLALINPQKQKDFTINFSVNVIGKELHVSAGISHEKVVYVKFKGKFLIL